MIILELSDFSNGKFALHKGMYTEIDIQQYIDKYEKRYILDLLGAAVGNEFIEDVQLGGGEPTEPRFLDIFNPIELDYGLQLIVSDGMKEMLKGFIYYEYLKDQVSQVTAVGMLTPKGENSESVSGLFTQLYTRYNDAVRSYKGVQRYITTRRGDYSGFNGRTKSLAYWL
jgi:hypothetical protein